MQRSEIHYHDTVTLRHKDSKVFLHSHIEKYPLKYDDGRISSQGWWSFSCGTISPLTWINRPAGHGLCTQRYE